MRILILAAVLIVLTALAALAWHWFNSPLYQPGDIRAGRNLREPLSPPAQDGVRPGYWCVAKDTDLFHFEEGSGEDILTVHGGPGFVLSAKWLAGAELGTGYRLLYYHQRGCGASTRPTRSLAGKNFHQSMQALNSTLGLPAQVSDIERIRRLLGREKIVLAGHSFGAFLVALYAAEFPEHVRALIAVAPANLAVLPNRDADVFELIRKRLPAEKQSEFAAFLKEYFDFHGAASKTEDELAALHRRFGMFYLAAAPASMKLPAGGGNMKDNGGYMPLAVYLSMGRRHDYREAFRTVTAPVLVIHGEDDLQPATWSRNFAALFPHHRTVEIAGAGHFVFDDQPARFAAIVKQFLAALRPSKYTYSVTPTRWRSWLRAEPRPLGTGYRYVSVVANPCTKLGM
jgi:proline iminopeptidase